MWPKEPLPGRGSKLAGSPGPSGLVAERWQVAEGRAAALRPPGWETPQAPSPTLEGARAVRRSHTIPRSLPRARGWPPRGRWLRTAQAGTRASQSWLPDRRAAGQRAGGAGIREISHQRAAHPAARLGPRLRVSETGKPKLCSETKGSQHSVLSPIFFLIKISPSIIPFITLKDIISKYKTPSS